MSNTVITNYTDLNGPSTKADSSVVVIVNKDGSLSVDQKLLGTLMGTDESQAAGISVVRVGHEGRPDDATDSESDDDDKVPHVTLSVDSYYDEPNSIIKYDSGAEMLQSLRIETRENSLVGFQNDHCYTQLTSPGQVLPQKSDSFTAFDDPVIEITHTPPPKPIPGTKKITILEQQIIPKGKKIVLNTHEPSVILKGNDVLNKPLPILTKSKHINDLEKSNEGSLKIEENTESSSISSGESIPDRDSDSDYKDTKDRTGSLKVRRSKLKPKVLKSVQPTKNTKIDPKVASRLKSNRSIIRKEIKEKIQSKSSMLMKKQSEVNFSTSRETSLLPSEPLINLGVNDITKAVVKHTPKIIRKEKKTPAHVTALLSDMTSLFSTPDVIRRVSTDNNKPTLKNDKEPSSNKKPEVTTPETNEEKSLDNNKLLDNLIKPTRPIPQKTYAKQKDKNVNPTDKAAKGYDLIPQLDDASLAQIFQDTTGITNPVKVQPNVTSATTMNSPSLAGPLSPTLDLLAGLQPEEEGLTEDLLMHVAQLVESSENLQEVIDKQVLGKVDTISTNSTKPLEQTPFQQAQVPSNLYTQTTTKTVKNVVPRKDPIEIIRRDGRVITLPPIEAPATRASKRKSQVESAATTITLSTPAPVQSLLASPESQIPPVSKQYINKKLTNKKQEPIVQAPVIEKMPAESQESWNSEDDPNRLWCICKQPHNNRFMICCDGCEEWFHGKCVNITKAMGQQMEDQGIEWRCPNCVKKNKPMPKTPTTKVAVMPKKLDIGKAVTTTTVQPALLKTTSKTSCIVCKKPARASSIYCSDSCILKHAQDSLSVQGSSTKADSEQGKSQDKQKAESRVIVYERKTGRLLAGPNAPTAENLRIWLQKNPTFEVVRPGTLSTIKPNIAAKKTHLYERNKIQTTLNFERIPKKANQPVQVQPAKLTSKVESSSTPVTRTHAREETKVSHSSKTPVSSKSHQPSIFDSPKPSTSTAKSASESRKAARISARSHSSYDKTPTTPSTSRKNSTPDNKSRMNSNDNIRENVRKTLQEQLQIRMAENTGAKFTEEEIRLFSFDTEYELHELFKDVGMKYKAKYRSLMFNIKDRKNLSLWQKICDRTITAKQLVRLSPEELASQELAQWRDKEAKYQLELIKKSELDLLAASKTYVLKTHKGEEVMETKESVSTELDPNVPVEDLVTALNDSVTDGTEEPTNIDTSIKVENTVKKYGNSKKKSKEDNFGHSKKSSRDSKRNSESRKSRSSRRKSEIKEKMDRSTRKSERRSSRARTSSRDRHKEEKRKSESTERRHRSRSRGKSRRRSKSRERSRDHSRSTSQGRERSRSRECSKRRSRSRDDSRKRHRSPSKHRSSTEEKHKHRSRSQENTKIKTDSTDSDSIERPKSAMLKEAHPEYDPHEPMITSAFSEEDLRKSREDVYEDSFKNDIKEYKDDAVEYDSSKAFVIDTDVILPSEKHVDKRVSEAESDQEPSSTVDNSTVAVWNGCINMVDVARFYVAAHEVSGSATDLEDDLSAELDIVGRINPDTVWDYIGKMKRASNKDIIILRLQAANDEERMQYIALYSYLSSRNRLGVVKVANATTVKDFYIVPLPANTTLPPVLLPLDGPGLGEVRTHLLLAIVIRQRRKRMAPRIAKDVIPAKVSRESHPRRSYTPPLTKISYTPPTSPRRRLPLPAYTSPALSTSVKDKIAATLACADEEEAYSPGSSSSGGSGTPISLRTKMDELNRQIEEQKQQILNMARADSSSVEDEEAYSPSRPMTPPTPAPAPVVPLAEIALPSNLHEILATIKQRETTADVDMRIQPQGN